MLTVGTHHYLHWYVSFTYEKEAW